MEFEQILQLINAVSDSELSSFSMEKDGISLSMTTDKTVAGQPEADGEEKTEKELTKTEVLPSDKIVKAPLVGIFYAAPSEGAEAFVKAGDTVKKGQVIGIIEAMKLMNEIECDYDGVVDAVLIENEQVVEYGQPLFRIR